MRVYVVGVDGYLGWSLAQYLAAQGHTVDGVDNLLRRERWVPDMKSQSVIPIASPEERIKAFKKHFGEKHFKRQDRTYVGEATDYTFIRSELRSARPQCIVNLAQMPSAPYSMMDFGHCVHTFENNMKTTFTVLWAVKELMPDIPIVTIGSAGEYGTPGVEIAEGNFELEYKGRKTTIPFPRMLPASYYHATKVSSSINIERACTWWGLRATDIMQSVVYGTRHEHMPKDQVMDTRMDADEAFSTCVNRFVIQAAVGHPLTVYGEGRQKRGFLPLRDSMRCLQLLIENPPDKGEYRVVNQYDQIYSIAELAEAVREVGAEFGLKVKVRNLENPRTEAPEHHYVIERKKLVELGYEPRGELKEELRKMFEDVLPLKNRIMEIEHTIDPRISWKKGRR